jgi:hypothetical protein
MTERTDPPSRGAQPRPLGQPSTGNPSTGGLPERSVGSPDFQPSDSANNGATSSGPARSSGLEGGSESSGAHAAWRAADDDETATLPRLGGAGRESSSSDAAAHRASAAGQAGGNPFVPDPPGGYERASARSTTAGPSSGLTAPSSGAAGSRMGSGTAVMPSAPTRTEHDQEKAEAKAKADAEKRARSEAKARAAADRKAQKAAVRLSRRAARTEPQLTRRARLRLLRVDPWSVMKTSFLLSIALGIMCVVAVFLVYSFLSAAGLWDNVNSTVARLLGQRAGEKFDINQYVTVSKVMGVTMLISAVDVVIITALATLGAFIYNLSASLLGGLEVTLGEDQK